MEWDVGFSISLHSVIQALQFHLGEVLGMARWKERFGDLGISTDFLQGQPEVEKIVARKPSWFQGAKFEILTFRRSKFTCLGIIRSLAIIVEFNYKHIDDNTSTPRKFGSLCCFSHRFPPQFASSLWVLLL